MTFKIGAPKHWLETLGGVNIRVETDDPPPFGEFKRKGQWRICSQETWDALKTAINKHGNEK